MLDNVRQGALPDLDRKLIAGEIAAAFQEVTCPHQLTRTNPHGLDRDLMEDFRGKSWQSIASDVMFLSTHHDFAFFTIDSFRYFLPAFLIGSLNNPAIGDVRELLIPSLLFRLDPPDWASPMVALRDELLELLSEQQKRGIQSWLRYMLEVTPEEDRLRAANENWAALVATGKTAGKLPKRGTGKLGGKNRDGGDVPHQS